MFYTDLALKSLLAISDILLVSIIVYYVIKIFRNNIKAIQILKGIFFVYILFILSNLFNLETTKRLVEYIIEMGVLIIIIIFQPEIRNGLERVGRKSKASVTHKKKNISTTTTDVLNTIIEACEYLSKRRIGALITIEREESLQQYISKAVQMDAVLTTELLTTLFVQGTPLHDGAVILADNKVMCAGAYYPVSESATISTRLGTRHRAAIGISEKYDCLTIVVSEETGNISVSIDGELIENLSRESLELFLEKYILKN